MIVITRKSSFTYRPFSFPQLLRCRTTTGTTAGTVDLCGFRTSSRSYTRNCAMILWFCSGVTIRVVYDRVSCLIHLIDYAFICNFCCKWCFWIFFSLFFVQVQLSCFYLVCLIWWHYVLWVQQQLIYWHIHEFQCCIVLRYSQNWMLWRKNPSIFVYFLVKYAQKRQSKALSPWSPLLNE